MGRYLPFVLVCVLVASFAPPAESAFVNAELETGTLDLDFPFGGLHATAPGLSIFASAGAIDAGSYPLSQCLPCKPGDVVSFSGNWEGTSGTVTSQGTTYFTGGALDPLNLFGVSTPTIVVPPLGDPFTVVLPFTLSFEFSNPGVPPYPPGPLTVDAFGAGFVTVQFEPAGFVPGAWATREADYRIAPEPATWLLVASGILVPVGQAGLRRRRKRRT
jgi:hypothetical protein